MWALCNYYKLFFNRLSRFIEPIVLLAVRLWMANIFWQSGQVKYYEWAETVELFKNVYKVPILDPEVAAYFALGIELICPVLLVLGFFTRLATIPMLVMTAIIQFSFIHSTEHFYWVVLLATVLCRGGGFFSLDYFIAKKVLYI